MKKIEVRKLVNVDNETLDKISEWMYNWWGQRDGYSKDAVKCFMQHSMEDNRLPQTYGVFLDNEIIGMYQFAYDDLSVRPDIYPWLANVYIDEKNRGKGYGRRLLESVFDNAKENIDFDELFLYTKYIGLYEKFGWNFIDEVDTFKKEQRIERLYKLDLRSERSD